MPKGMPLLIIEGSGETRETLMPWINVVWVQADFETAKARGFKHDGSTPEVVAFWDEWMLEELPFFSRERADVIVSGTPYVAYGATSQVIVAQRQLGACDKSSYQTVEPLLLIRVLSVASPDSLIVDSYA